MSTKNSWHSWKCLSLSIYGKTSHEVASTAQLLAPQTYWLGIQDFSLKSHSLTTPRFSLVILNWESQPFDYKDSKLATQLTLPD